MLNGSSDHSQHDFMISYDYNTQWLRFRGKESSRSGYTRLDEVFWIAETVEILGSGSERDRKKESKAKGRESMSRDVKGEIAVLGEGKAVPSDNLDSKPPQEVEKITWSSSRS